MKLSNYQSIAHETSMYTNIGGVKCLYPILGLNGEAGELANKIKKVFRDRKGELTPELHDELVDELGDVLWYVAEIASALMVDLEYVAKKNLLKLEDRKERDVIGGSGDKR